MSKEEQALRKFLDFLIKNPIQDIELSEYGKEQMAKAIKESDKFMRFIGMKK